jgi:Polysaccharide lyase
VRILVLAAVVVGALLSGTPAHASVIWDGDAARASAPATFGIDNCDAPGSISAVADAARGRVWRFDKPAGSNRCEAHGFKVGGKMYHFGNGGTYYLGWSGKLSSLTDNNATFQWKSYGDHIQNYPVVLKMVRGKFTMLQRQPENQTFYPWSRAITANSWNHIVLGIHTSDALTGGWVELYLNGEQQTFTNGAKRWPCRTWDSSNDPKWGVYGAEGSPVTNFVDDLKVGTSLADVRAGAVAPPPATASASPSAAPSAAGSPTPSAGPAEPSSGATTAPPPAADAPLARSSASRRDMIKVALAGGAGSIVGLVIVAALVVRRRRRPAG